VDQLLLNNRTAGYANYIVDKMLNSVNKTLTDQFNHGTTEGICSTWLLLSNKLGVISDVPWLRPYLEIFLRSELNKALTERLQSLLSEHIHQLDSHQYITISVLIMYLGNQSL
jgi:hypothetical protein